MTDSILSQMYKAHRAQTSGSAIYAPSADPAQRPNLYAGSQQYQGLGSYDRTKADPLAVKPGESQEAWERRTAVHRRAAEAETQAEQEAQAWAEHRSHVDNRTGTGTGLFGNDAPESRAAIIGNRGFGTPGVGQGEAWGHIRPESLAAKTPLSAAEVNQIMKQREAERMGQQPVRSDVTSRSTGTGFLGVDR